MKSKKAPGSYMKRRRKAALAKGYCTICCTRKPSGTNRTCDWCQTKNAECRRRSANPFCITCFTCHPRGVHVSVPQLLPRTA